MQRALQWAMPTRRRRVHDPATHVCDAPSHACCQRTPTLGAFKLGCLQSDRLLQGRRSVGRRAAPALAAGRNSASVAPGCQGIQPPLRMESNVDEARVKGV